MEANINQSGSPACGSTPSICTQSAQSAVSPTPLVFRWEAEVSAPRPFRARAFHGESFTLACTPTQYAKPLAGLSGAAVALRWQTDGMDPDEWYEAPGAYDPATGTLSAAWSPDCDTGPDRVRFFLALETPGGASFRAFGTLDLAPSPGFTPAQRLPESELDKLRDALQDEATARQQADNALETALQDHTKRCVPLLNPGERADPDTHGKTALVTQNGTQGGFAVSGQAGADPDSEAYVTRYQCDAITAFGADETVVERYLIGPQNRNQPKSILRIGDLAATKPVTVTPESVGYVQKVTLALQIDRETLAHATAKDAIDWVPSSKAVKAALDQKAEKTHTHTTAQVTGLDAKLNAKADAAHTHDNRYLRLSGGTLTGNVSASGSVTISVPILEALNYFVARSLVNEASHPYNHALYLGYYNHNQCDFYEVGGVYNFRMGDGASARIIGQITQNGIVELGTKLADKYAAKSHTHATAQITGLDAALAAKADAADVYTKAEVDGKVAGVYHYKGSVANPAALPAAPAVGDVYNVQDEDGQNVAWTGSAWDALGATVDLSAYDTAQTTQGKITAAVAPKANSADVYPKAQTYTKTEVDTLVAQAVANAKAELLEQLKTLYAPLSSVQATVGGTTYRWVWDDTFQTFAMQAVAP